MTHTSRPLATVVLAATLALLGTGCGNRDSRSAASSGTGAPARSDAGTARTQAVKFSACMRSNGVADFPDPNGSNDFEYGISVSQQIWTQAVEACKTLQPPGTLSAKRTPQEQSTALQFAACIREHGVADFPDPVNGEPLVDTTKIPSSNADGGMTILNAAMAACRAVVGELLGDRK